MLSVGIKLFSAGQVQDYGSQMAAATLVLLPIIVVFLFCQRFFIENATSSGVKGCEAAFKAVAHALQIAITPTKSGQTLSTKGVL